VPAPRRASAERIDRFGDLIFLIAKQRGDDPQGVHVSFYPSEFDLLLKENFRPRFSFVVG